MNRSYIGVVVCALVVFVASTARGQTPPSGPPVPIVRGRVIRAYTPPIPLKTFVARVAAITDGEDGQCREYALPIDGQNRRLIRYTVGSGAVRRQVELQIDENGKRLQYIEMRGDLQLVSTEPATSISLDFVKQTAQASNEADGKMEVANGTLAEALDAENLGVPRQMLEFVERLCLHK